MCGIAGIINFKRENQNDKILKKIIDKIKHRGPDHDQIIQNSLGCFGYVRLKIIDISSKSNQPFEAQNGKVKLFYNGEIYNFQELKNKHLGNIQLKSKGDGEVLIYLYLKYGIDFVNLIKGMYSISVIDEKKNKVYLIRDRFGIKPLYYNISVNKELTYCSEIEPILCNKKIQKIANNREIFKNLEFGIYNSTDETWFKGINQLKPGHYMEISKNNILIKKYYDLSEKINEDFDNSKKEYNYWLKKIKGKIIKSFKQHSITDVDTGLHISGGVDSNVLANMSNYTNKNLSAFTFSFKEKFLSEKKDAMKISKKHNFKHYFFEIKPDDLFNDLLNVLKIQFEPFSSLRLIATHKLYNLSKQKNCKVIFDGSGGDEIGAGYTYQIIPWILDMIKQRDTNLNFEMFDNILSKGKRKLNINEFIFGSFSNFYEPGSTTVDGSFYKIKNLINKDFIEKNNDSDFILKKPFKSFLRNSQYNDLYTFKLPRYLKFIDRSSMKNSIETRLPFLDHEIVETYFQVPSNYKIFKDNQRTLLKDVFKQTNQSPSQKKGKNTIADPQSIWLKTHLKEPFYEYVIFNKKKTNIFNSSNVEKYYNEYRKSKSRLNSFFLFQILIIELWHQEIINI